MRLLGALLIVFLIVVGVGFYMGWFRFSAHRDPTTNQVDLHVQIDKGRIAEDSQRLKEKLGQFSEKVREGAREAAKKIRPATSTVKGELMKVDEGASRLTVATPDHGPMTFEADGSTRIHRNGVEVGMGELLEGDHLQVVYRDENGKHLAESVTVEPGA